MPVGIVYNFLILYFAFSISSKLEDDIRLRNVSKSNYGWHQSDTSIALLDGPKIIWQFNYNDLSGKQYFYPLNTKTGQNLVWLRPKDHPWHYGLWFSWKFINNSNFWEEDKNTGVSEGKVTVSKISKKLADDFTATFYINLSYSPDRKNEVLSEKRIIVISPPDTMGNYFIDWSMHFTSKSDTVTLDRTPPEKLGGPRYGGYAGLSFRASSDMTEHLYIDSNGWTNEERLVGHGIKARWMDLSGAIPGMNTRPGLAMFNHPQNDEQIAWYVFKDGDFAFFNAGILFDKPMILLPNSEMNIKYRVMVHSQELSSSAINKFYQKYID